MKTKYDIIVIGGGHAGCEAAAVAANLGSKVLLITMDMTKFANMSCNPAMGGIAKGQIVREIDALGGYSALVTDKTMIQFRMLNKSKGPAMWSPRAQSDRVKFSIEWRNVLEKIENLSFWQDTVTELIFENNTLKGVKTAWNVEFFAEKIILTAGTFLNGLMHVGQNQLAGGRVGDSASFGLSEQIASLGVKTNKMKTGTPARIDGRTLDFSKMIEQKGDEFTGKFSFSPHSKMELESRSCYMVYTNKEVHDILKTGFEFSPLFNGVIEGIGPRYCPSIEDKLVTFSDRDRHLLFLEPEGTDTIEYYLNGFSSSLPLDVQMKAMRKIPGFENVKIFKPAYAIEYDYFAPTQLYHTLESKIIPNLYFAGQMNGTTGYEEAAAQGLMAGINAHLKLNNKEEFVLQRDEAYIGVLIDDLVLKGVDEPYRMFTSRAEFRILLRQDNADLRLTPKARKLGLISDEMYDYFILKNEKIDNIIKFLNTTSITPDEINPILTEKGSNIINQKTRFSKLLMRPEVYLTDLLSVSDKLKDFIKDVEISKDEILDSVEIKIKYQNYIEREKQNAEKSERLKYVNIPEKIDYSIFKSLSNESRQKLEKIKPRNISEASRIPGVTPSDINVLLVFLGR